MTRRVVTLGTALLVLILGVIWAVGAASERVGAARAQTAEAQRNASVVAAAYRRARDSVIMLTDAQRRVVTEVSDTTDRAVAALRLELGAAHSLLLDSAATRAALRASLARVTARADSLLVRLAAERTERARLDTAHAAERRALIAGFEQVHAADAKVIRALERERCRVLWLDCPTRTQVAVGSVLVTAIAFIAAR